MQSNPALDFSVRESEFFQQLLARIGSARPRKLEIGAAVMMHSLPPPHSSKLDGHHGIIQSYDSDHDSWMIGNVSGYDSSGPDAEEEDDMHDLEHSSVTVGEDEMRARIADAMRGLHRLEHIIDPRELPGLTLRVGAQVEIHSLQSSHELNGVRGEIVRPLDLGTGRWGVLAATGRDLALKPVNLRLAENAPQLGFRYCSSHSPLSPPERVRESWSHSHARITHLF